MIKTELDVVKKDMECVRAYWRPVLFLLFFYPCIIIAGVKNTEYEIDAWKKEHPDEPYHPSSKEHAVVLFLVFLSIMPFVVFQCQTLPIRFIAQRGWVLFKAHWRQLMMATGYVTAIILIMVLTPIYLGGDYYHGRDCLCDCIDVAVCVYDVQGICRVESTPSQ